MHPAKLAAFMDRLNSLFAAMDSPEHQKAIEERRTERVVYNNKFFQLSQVTHADFDNLLTDKMTREDDWGKRFSRESLRDELYGIIVARLNGENVEEYVKAMIERLDASHPQTRVFVPLSGASLGGGVTFDFGRVSLVQMNKDNFAAEISKKLPADVRVQPERSVIVYYINVERDLDDIALYASYTVDADAIKAASLVDEYVGPIADYLQFCLAYIVSSQFSCIVDYKGRYTKKNVNTAIVIDTATEQGTLLPIDDKLSIRMEIGEGAYPLLLQRGIPELAPLFGLDDLKSKDEYLQLIYRAIRVFADGERSHSPRQKILSYVTACELFFSQKVETTRAVTEGVAYVLGRNYDERKKIIEAMEKMYDARSSATHEGLEPDNLAIYRAQILEVLSHMIYLRKLEPEKFKTKENLAEYLDRQRFSGEIVP